MQFEKVWILISWLQQKPADLDLHFFQKSIQDFKNGVHAKLIRWNTVYSKTCVQRPLSKRPNIGFQDKLSLNAGQKYFRMLQEEHSAILSTFIKLPFVIKIFVLSILSGRFTQVLLYNSKSYKNRCNRMIIGIEKIREYFDEKVIKNILHPI